MKQQFVVTHTTRQTGIPAPLDRPVTNSFRQNVVSTAKFIVRVFPVTLHALSAGLLKMGQVFTLYCNIPVGISTTKNHKTLQTQPTHINEYVY